MQRSDNFGKFVKKKKGSAIKEEIKQEKKKAKRERASAIEEHYERKRLERQQMQQSPEFGSSSKKSQKVNKYPAKNTTGISSKTEGAPKKTYGAPSKVEGSTSKTYPSSNKGAGSTKKIYEPSSKGAKGPSKSYGNASSRSNTNSKPYSASPKTEGRDASKKYGNPTGRKEALSKSPGGFSKSGGAHAKGESASPKSYGASSKSDRAPSKPERFPAKKQSSFSKEEGVHLKGEAAPSKPHGNAPKPERYPEKKQSAFSKEEGVHLKGEAAPIKKTIAPVKPYVDSPKSKGAPARLKGGPAKVSADSSKPYNAPSKGVIDKPDAEQLPLNKYIAHGGICSRRDAADLVKEGKVTVNGTTANDPGMKVTYQDVVMVGNRKVIPSRNFVYILLNKPKDFITTSEDPQGRKTVLDLVRSATDERVYPVGRLDRNTSGVLLLTNDGDLAQKLSHPKHEIKKVYEIKLDRSLTKGDMDKIAGGLMLEDGYIAPDVIAYADAKDKSIIGIEIHSGRNRIVRRIFEHMKYDVKALDRVMFAGLTKKDVLRGKWRFLKDKEIRLLKFMNQSYIKSKD